MGGFFLMLLVLLIGIVFYGLTLYNWFVKAKTRLEAAVQEIGNQLKRQAGLIPNLVESVKGYMKHEKDIFKEITEARKSVLAAVKEGGADKLIEAGTRLEKAIAPIRAVFESTPQLQAAGPTVKLMDELRDTADKLMYSRRTLIDLTADYNARTATFPSNLVAMMFNFGRQAGIKMPETGAQLEVTKEETETPKVKLN
ncbi:MAG: LemA family protein [Candidatus Pacebacteria bacterium]|nr:LemA family protein [Candidatus Paceibacterota bacterium]